MWVRKVVSGSNTDQHLMTVHNKRKANDSVDSVAALQYVFFFLRREGTVQ